MLNLFLAVWRSSFLGLVHIFSPSASHLGGRFKQIRIQGQSGLHNEILPQKRKNNVQVLFNFVKCVGQHSKVYLGLFSAYFPCGSCLPQLICNSSLFLSSKLGVLTVLSSLLYQEMNVLYYQQSVCLFFLSYHLIPNARHFRNNGRIEAISLGGIFLLKITFCHLFVLIILQLFISFCLHI